MLLLFFIVASFLSAHNHQDLEKYILNVCSLPGTASRIVGSPSSFHNRCEKALKKAEEGLENATASELKAMKKDAKRAIEHLEDKIKHVDSEKPRAVSVLTKVGTAGVVATTVAAIKELDNNDNTLCIIFSVGATACGLFTIYIWSYNQNKWVQALKDNEKSVDKFKDRLKERYKDKKH